MKKKLILILFILNFAQLLAQGEANIWYFGENAGLDFNSGSAEILLDGALLTNEGCATISDTSGNLLFYTDGSTVYNKNHTVMINGTDLKGDSSTTQSAIIVPMPGNNNIYYIFTVDNDGEADGLQYSIVDITLDNGLGEITSKNNLLQPYTNEKIIATKNFNSTGYWIVSHKHNSDEFISYELTNTGLNTTPVISAVGSNSGINSYGQIKISPNGSKLIVARGEVQLFDFNNQSGKVSNPITLFTSTQYATYGVEFSSNNNLVYVSHFDGVFQFNLEAGTSNDIINSYVQLQYAPSKFFSSMQLASNGKIYIAKLGRSYLDVIDSPNIVGLGCNYIHNGQFLGGRKSRLGLPTFISNIFSMEDSITFENNCLGEQTKFYLATSVDSITWDFGDPASGINNTSTILEPTHEFSAPGIYTVTITATSGGETASTTLNVIISEVPTATQPQNILECDNDNNGFFSFDLSTQDSGILNGQSDATFEVIYYASMADYTANTPIPDKTDYTNTTAYTSQTIIASVVNKNNNACEDNTSFTIQVFESPIPSQSITPLSFCDNTSVGTDTDGLIEFNLRDRESDILNGQSSTVFTVTYFRDAAYTDQILNPTTFQNTVAGGQPIYVRMTHNLNSDCYADTSFITEVFELPVVTPIVELRQCDDDIDGYSLFNLNEVIDEITVNASIETITFHELLGDAETGDNPIPNPTTYENGTVSNDVVWASVKNGNDCIRTSQVNLFVSTTQIPLTFATRNFYECDDAISGTITDGISSFDFSTVNTEIEALFPVGQQLNITYYRNLADALAESNAITDITDYRNNGYPTTQNIYIRVDSLVDNDCLGLGSHITLHVEEIPVANPITIDDECDDDGDGMFAFDTSNYESTIIGSQTDVNVIYTDENGLPLPSPLPNPFLTATQTITVRVENALSQDADGACFDETTISFSVDAAAVANPIADFIECDDDIDGLYSFDTSTIESTVLNGQTGMIVTYTDSNGTLLPSPLPNPFLTGNETITIRVENPLNTICFDETTFEFIVRERPQFELKNEDVICINESPTLDIETFNPNGTYTYQWTGPNGFSDTGETTTVSEGGVYSVIATSSFNCPSFEQQITIAESELASISLSDIQIVDDSSNNTITILTTNLGFGDYEFALNDEFGEYQDEPIFTNVPAGIHVVYVRDKNDCGTTSIEVSVIGFPNFFTPNEDGTNDYWNVKGINSRFYSASKIYIYDRFGKIISIVDPLSDGWDGFYNGNRLPETDYWFSVQLIDSKGNIKERKGHFSLIRR